MNPFTLIPSGAAGGQQLVAFPLDIRLELDDTARFRSGVKWGDVEFPLPFGRMVTPAEVREVQGSVCRLNKIIVYVPMLLLWDTYRAPTSSHSSLQAYIDTLDAATGASLKFTVLNPKGRVWLMVAGGGASVIYTDTVGDLGYAQVRHVLISSFLCCFGGDQRRSTECVNGLYGERIVLSPMHD